MYMTLVALTLIYPEDPRFLKLLNTVVWIFVTVVGGFGFSIAIAGWKKKRGSEAARRWLTYLCVNEVDTTPSGLVHLRNTTLAAAPILAGATLSGFSLLAGITIFFFAQNAYLNKEFING
jgi:hypothetical protein